MADIQIGDRVILTDYVTERYWLDPGLTGTVKSINHYSDGMPEYVVYLDFVQIQPHNGCLFVAGKMWDWFNSDEVEVYDETTEE